MKFTYPKHSKKEGQCQTKGTIVRSEIFDSNLDTKLKVSWDAGGVFKILGYEYVKNLIEMICEQENKMKQCNVLDSFQMNQNEYNSWLSTQKCNIPDPRYRNPQRWSLSPEVFRMSQLQSNLEDLQGGGDNAAKMGRYKKYAEIMRKIWGKCGNYP